MIDMSTVDKEGRVKTGSVILVPKDYVPVVRCKDCKWWEVVDEDNGMLYGECGQPFNMISDAVFINESWYCANGERKEDDER